MYSTLTVDGDESQFIEDDAHVAVTFSGSDATHRCVACGEDLTDTTQGYESELTGGTCPCADDDAHDPELVSLSWVNSAAILTDDGEDSVTVTISVGDPRGAFCFTVRRIPSDAPGDLAGRLVLHTPYPGMGMLHRPLTQLRPGTFVIG
jgi:hypothetical protein